MDLVKHVIWSLNQANNSGDFQGLLYNSICSQNCKEYLQVSAGDEYTLFSALFGNDQVHATVVDEFIKSTFSGQVDVLNLEFHNINIINFLKKPVDVFVYSGDRSEDAITKVWNILASKAIIIIDNWNFSHTRQGVETGIKKVGANVVEKFEIRHGTVRGLAIFVIDKRIVSCTCNECECTQCSCRM